jgi:hypothetical protein
MRTFCCAAMIAVVMTASAAVAQTTPQDSAHTTLAPAAANPGRAGQVVQLPGGGQGITTGGTAHYQTLTTPGGGSATMVPNGGGTSSVIGSGGRVGTTAVHP